MRSFFAYLIFKEDNKPYMFGYEKDNPSCQLLSNQFTELG